MSELEVPPPAESVAGLTQIQRITNSFVAPSKTFEDIKRGNRSWWLPFLLYVLVGTALWATVTSKVTWEQVLQNGFNVSPKSAEQLENLPPGEKEIQMRRAVAGQKWTWAAAPVGVLLMDLIAAAVLLGTINFGFGGRANFSKVLAVIWYGGLPGLIKLLLGGIGLYAGVAPESFLPANPAGTNLGYYLPAADTNKVLYALATAIDPITIWSLVLTAIGLSIVAGTKRSAGYAAVFGWWALLIIISTGFAAAFS